VYFGGGEEFEYVPRRGPSTCCPGRLSGKGGKTKTEEEKMTKKEEQKEVIASVLPNFFKGRIWPGQKLQTKCGCLVGRRLEVVVEGDAQDLFKTRGGAG